ncbi:hypothetical protein LRAMOSA07408 [Lichtheimia ramosa]|uniref:Major facilitator superfamily (MFS) profile domain-containing protein n=1 Tax=Lichtheimia ramosa TaxID=688394 RepID=A0A077WCS0_9FUNG|nr:hypothetical protein LRAMOSA07408 [Lichtheimia ramosa]
MTFYFTLHKAAAHYTNSRSAKAAGLVGVVTHSFMMQRFGIDGEFIIFGIIASLSCVTVFLFLQETSGPGVMEKADEDFERYLRTRSKA